MKRFSKSRPCPICNGYDGMKRNNGKRCYGFLSDDGNYAHCTRDEFSNGLPQIPNSDTFAHLLYGACNCGTEHNPKQTGTISKPKQPSTLTADGFIAEYDYLDESGEFLYQVCKKTGKKFLQRRLGTDGEWIWNLDGVRRVLYGLPELLKAEKSETVFIVEGEKDVKSLRSVGLTATTNSGGAGKWLDEFNQHLKDRPVIILPDNDKDGRAHAIKIADSLKGTAKSIKIVHLPDLPVKGDVSDWLELGGTVEKLNELIKKDSIQQKISNIISAADLMAKEFPDQRYAVEGIFSEGVTIVAGKPKLGKSWFGLGTAVAVASGGKVLGSIPVEQGNVLYLALEDGERRLQKRMELMLGNSGVIPADLEFAFAWKPLDTGGIGQLEDWLIAHPKARIIFIDTLKRVRPKDSSRQVYDSDYDAISPLGDLARKYGVSIVLIHHTRKLEAEDPMDMISGSFGLTGSADGVLVLTRARMSTQAKLHVIGRDSEDKELILDWNSGTFGWTLSGDAGELAVSKERKDIIEILSFYPTRLTPKEVAKELNRNEASVRKMMNRMNNDGQIDNDGLGNYTVINKNNKSESQVSQVSLKSQVSQVSLKSQTSESHVDVTQSHSPCHSKTAINTNEDGDLSVRVTQVTPVTPESPNNQNEKSSDSSSDTAHSIIGHSQSHSTGKLLDIPTHEMKIDLDTAF
jgi:hypothetical protein